jgi:hypothetical protein
MRMPESRDYLNLAMKSLSADCGAELAMKQLERYRAIVPDVMSEINPRHPTTPDLTLDFVAA